MLGYIWVIAGLVTLTAPNPDEWTIFAGWFLVVLGALHMGRECA